MNNFCSECGGPIDQTTGVCTRCHKQAFTVNNTSNDVKSILNNQAALSSDKKKKPNIKLILIIAGLVFLLAIGGVVAYNLLSSNIKKNKIDYKRSVTTYYNALDDSEIYVITMEYDKRGNLTEYEYETEDYSYSQKGKYDENDQLVKWSHYDQDGKLEGTYTRENEYDRNKNLIYYEEYDEDDKLVYSCTRDYDDKGNMLSDEYTYEDGYSYINEYEYEYDKKGNIIHEDRYYDGELSYSYENEYDKKGNMILQNTYDSEGKMTGYAEYEYDKKGREIARYLYDPDGTMNSYVETEYFDD